MSEIINSNKSFQHKIMLFLGIFLKMLIGFTDVTANISFTMVERVFTGFFTMMGADNQAIYLFNLFQNVVHNVATKGPGKDVIMNAITHKVNTSSRTREAILSTALPILKDKYENNLRLVLAGRAAYVMFPKSVRGEKLEALVNKYLGPGKNGMGKMDMINELTTLAAQPGVIGQKGLDVVADAVREAGGGEGPVKKAMDSKKIWEAIDEDPPDNPKSSKWILQLADIYVQGEVQKHTDTFNKMLASSGDKLTMKDAPSGVREVSILVAKELTPRKPLISMFATIFGPKTADKIMLPLDVLFSMLNPLRNDLGSGKFQAFVPGGFFILLEISALLMLLSCLSHFFKRGTTNRCILELNYKKYVAYVSKYISYYAPNFDTHRTWMEYMMGVEKKGPEGYPYKDEIVKKISYDTVQAEMFLRFTYSKLLPSDYVALSITKNTQESHLTSFNQLDANNFKNWGRMIGNVCTFSDSDSGKSYIMGSAQNIEYDSDPNMLCFTLKPKKDFASVAPKYAALAAEINKNLDKRRIIYSNFTEASRTLSAYFTSIELEHRFLLNDKTDAQYERIMKWVDENPSSILIIDSNYSEGLSVNGVDEMHILEPCDTVSKRDQTKARVARFESHPPNSTVKIIEWICTLSCLDPTRAYAKFNTWRKHLTHVWITDLLADHKQTYTPDAIVYRELNTLAISINKVVKGLFTKSVEQFAHKGYPDQCKPLHCTIAQVGQKIIKNTCASLQNTRSNSRRSNSRRSNSSRRSSRSSSRRSSSSRISSRRSSSRRSSSRSSSRRSSSSRGGRIIRYSKRK